MFSVMLPNCHGFHLQQHGSVYWKKGAEEVLKNLDSGLFLSSQLTNSFSIPDSPVWMDSSTQVYCKKLEDKIGGPQVG